MKTSGNMVPLLAYDILYVFLTCFNARGLIYTTVRDLNEMCMYTKWWKWRAAENDLMHARAHFSALYCTFSTLTLDHKWSIYSSSCMHRNEPCWSVVLYSESWPQPRRKQRGACWWGGCVEKEHHSHCPPAEWGQSMHPSCRTTHKCSLQYLLADSDRTDCFTHAIVIRTD